MGIFVGSTGGIAGAKEVMLFGKTATVFVSAKLFSILGSELEVTIPLGSVGELGAWQACIPLG